MIRKLLNALFGKPEFVLTLEDVLEYIDDYTCERMGVLHDGLMCYGGTRDSTEMYIINLISLIDRHLKEEI